jgi:hypothetical protein
LERDIAERDSAARERAYGYDMACGVGGEGRNAVKVGLAGAGSPKEVALGVVNGQEGVGAEGAAGRASQGDPSQVQNIAVKLTPYSHSWGRRRNEGSSIDLIVQAACAAAGPLPRGCLRIQRKEAFQD